MAQSNKKELVGRVVSDKMEKTIVVEVAHRKMHPIYHKYVQTSERIKAHDIQEEAKEGDKVKVRESRPISKQKKWILVEIIEKSK